MSAFNGGRPGRRYGLLAACCLGLVSLGATGDATVDAAVDATLDRYARPQSWVQLPDGRRLNLLCEGTGSPTVILEAGAGGSTLDWRRVQPPLARTTRVCSYDRAGLGFSEPGPLPRDAGAVVADLEALLRAAALAPPYVLVGHSLGSYFVRLYADRHLADVAGLVLVDPSVEFQDERFAEVNPALAALLVEDRANAVECLRLARLGQLRPELPVFRACTYGYAREPGFSEALYRVQIARRLSVPFREALLSETDEMPADSRLLAAERRSFGDRPLVVLTQSPETVRDYPGLTAAQVGAQNALWSRMHEELAALSTRGEHRIVAGSGHYIQKDRPDVVIEAIRRVVEDRRAAPGTAADRQPPRRPMMAGATKPHAGGLLP
ncbi:MAG: alpha/beta hydrolase [Proteobacteria bacterium]|nr:alpha/beta hydrolase [Pseudomonadota bacterium]